MRLLTWLVTNAVALTTPGALVDAVGSVGPSSGTAELRGSGRAAARGRRGPRVVGAATSVVDGLLRRDERR